MRGQKCVEDARERAYDPRIHPFRKMDCRVKPGNDGTRLRVRHHARCGIFGRSPRALPLMGGRGHLAMPGSMPKV